jgi:triacylglycerol lipase
MTVPCLRAPIVLVHGLFGFDRLQVGAWTVKSYFRGIPNALRAGGNRVLIAQLHPTGSIAERARQLKDFLDREAPQEPVHIFGHSMGGLDARYLISRLDMASRVLTLTTLGTPHRGTAFADWGVQHFKSLVSPMFDFFGVSYQAFEDLTRARCQVFNEKTPDAPGVRYFSVAGRFTFNWKAVHWGLPMAIVEEVEGPSDGIVSIASAQYGESCEVWDGDHLNLVNWQNERLPALGRGKDRIPDYLRLVQRLAAEGF